MPSGRRALLFASTLLAGAVLALALAEIGVRLLFPHTRDHVVPAGLFEIDDALGWTLRAGGGGTHETRYFDVEYRSNGLGHRDVERTLERPHGTDRLLFYGDSQIFGWGLPLEARFTNLLEARLADVEVWNLGVPGYGLDQQVIAYETRGLEYEADEVVLFATPQTLYRARFRHIYRKPKPRFEVGTDGRLTIEGIEAEASTRSDLMYRLLSPFYLPYFVDRNLQRLRHRFRERDGRPSETLFDERIRRILLRARDRAAQSSQRLSLLAHFDDPKTLAEIEAFAAEIGIRVLSIEMRGRDADLIFGPHDLHWNAEANRQIAEGILDETSEHQGR